MVHFGEFCGQTMLPDRSLFIGQKLAKCQNSRAQLGSLKFGQVSCASFLPFKKMRLFSKISNVVVCCQRKIRLHHQYNCRNSKTETVLFDDFDQVVCFVPFVLLKQIMEPLFSGRCSSTKNERYLLPGKEASCHPKNPIVSRVPSSIYCPCHSLRSEH